MAKKRLEAKKRGIAEKLVIACGFLVGAYLGLVILQPVVFDNRFGFGSSISGVDVSLKTVGEARSLLEDRWKQYSGGSLVFENRDVRVSDFAKSLDIEKTLEIAENNEQKGYFALSKYFGVASMVKVESNNAGIAAVLSKMYNELAIAPENAVISNINTGQITPEVTGRRLMLAESREAILQGLSGLNTSIPAVVVDQVPLLTAEEAKTLLGSVREATSTPVYVSGAGEKTEISSRDLTNWIKIVPRSAKTLVEQDSYIYLPAEGAGYDYIDSSKVYLFVSGLSAKVNRTATNAKLGMADGKLSVLTPSVTGRTLQSVTAANDIQTAVTGNHKVTLKVVEQKPQVTENNLDELGITEQISEGWSDAAGSPKNRTHNFTVGTAKFNGVLISPGETFSFNKNLGDVDASTGYLPELVILQNKTVPEYGGGLCQVSSTIFRAALNAGLPIVERHNHAYPVTYYKPYGVDATIYLPSPDLKFTNDTGHYILVQTKVVGTKVYFDFFGTKKPGKVVFSGSKDPVSEVPTVEQVTPTLTDQGARGKNSFTATFYRHIYDLAGKLTDNDKFTSKYDTPDNYPH